jgi:hypothetical protein
MLDVTFSLSFRLSADGPDTLSEDSRIHLRKVVCCVMGAQQASLSKAWMAAAANAATKPTTCSELAWRAVAVRGAPCHAHHAAWGQEAVSAACPAALAGGDAARIPAGIVSVASKTPAARIALRIMADTLPGWPIAGRTRGALLAFLTWAPPCCRVPWMATLRLFCPGVSQRPLARR